MEMLIKNYIRHNAALEASLNILCDEYTEDVRYGLSTIIYTYTLHA